MGSFHIPFPASLMHESVLLQLFGILSEASVVGLGNVLYCSRGTTARFCYESGMEAEKFRLEISSLCRQACYSARSVAYPRAREAVTARLAASPGTGSAKSAACRVAVPHYVEIWQVGL
jgi:hypothetical protein